MEIFLKKDSKIRTLLNGETLNKPQSLKHSTGSIESDEKSNPNMDFNPIEENLNSGDEKKRMDPQLIEKGLKSLENPVLRGSFSLVLSDDKLSFFDSIANKAFLEIVSSEISNVSSLDIGLNTIHLETDSGGVQNKRPGVYVIKNRKNGKCIIGQTANLKKRFNQYTSRSQNPFQKNNAINKNFFLAVQEAIKEGLAYRQVFQHFVVYTWVDENKKSLDVENSLELKNEMNYLEHRLILAFFESGLAYNIKDFSPTLIEQAILPEITNKNNPITRQALSQILVGPRQAKAFKVKDLYFQSSVDYEKFRRATPENRKKFLSLPYLRKKLRQNDQDSEIRYLNPEEVKKAREENLFYQGNS